jgi:3'-phosphoadenosine 5'-phosphosulfate sulfotransferase (PAPS reductase)/FAD synthetase
LNQYILPDGNVQIAFSGGRTSAFMLHQILEANGSIPERCRVMFSNTGREMPETLDFVQECSERWNVPVVWIEYRDNDGKHAYETVSHNSASRDGEPFAAIVAKRRYLPNQRAKYCTAELKIRPAIKYLTQGLGWNRWHSAIGIRADEAHRAKPSSEARTTAWFPLCKDGITKTDVARFWARQPFDLRLANIQGRTPLGNCDGCFLKSEANLAMLARDHPERHDWWVKMENTMRLRTDGSGNQFNQDFSRRSLGDFVKRQGDWIFDDTAYLCQVDGGECTA